MKRYLYIAAVLLSVTAMAFAPQGNRISPADVREDSDTVVPQARWKVQKTAPMVVADLDSSALDLRFPENIKQEVVYNDSTNMYIIGSKLGDSYLNTPILLTPEEYRQWSEKRERERFFRVKDAENVANKGKEKFDFADMHFNLGPAEKIFGPGGVRIKTQGTAELKLGANFKNVENPSLPERNRKTKAIDFDEKININVTGKVGDKVNMSLNYNTDATVDWDAKNLKLRYEGKEDEIIKLVEAGNVTFPSNNSLIKGASSLFGVRTDMQFGKLKLQTVLSQKNSTTKSVSTKGGTQLTPFELNVANYEENRHFFLAKYFRERYDAAMEQIPTLTTGINITRIEVWVTNKSGTTSNSRNILAFSDLAESTSSKWGGGTQSSVPSNNANGEYDQLITTYAGARDIDQATSILEGVMTGGEEFEKLSAARLLTSSEYTLNAALGYISLKTALQTDQVLAVAYEFTYGGRTYRVGEFAADHTAAGEALYVKALKNTSNNPQQPNWPLMMKNVYYLSTNVEKQKFRLDVKYQSDTTGVYITYIPEQQTKDVTLLRALGCDRLDNNLKAHPNGFFDYVEGYTVSNGRVFFPSVEPFGTTLENFLIRRGVDAETAAKYAFHELYDTTRTAALQMTDKNKFLLTGQFKGSSANVISLGASYVPQGSVVVTAGGVRLTEGSDYTVDYSAGEVTILNQSIIDAGTSVNVSLESNNDYGMQRKRMFGFNWEYDFSKNFQIGGTLQHLSEQALTSKVTMGSEPLKNTLWGLHVNWKTESQWLTNMLDKLPLLHCTQPSQITFTGEFAHLIAGTASGTQDNASYIDDFENAKSGISVLEPTMWVISSVPSMFPESKDKTSVSSGYNRSLLAWYTIDPLFTYRSSSLTPSHIKSDIEQLSNHYVRAVYVNELYPNRDQSTYSGATNTLPVMNVAYYPQERGPYNLSTDVTTNGLLNNPTNHWGGMMCKLNTNDFEASNIEYIEFWLMDPFIYTNKVQTEGSASYGGDLYIDLGEISEDILRDGKKFYESGMPVGGTGSFTETQWGKVPVQATQTYAFATTSGSRALQDVGLNGLNDEEERQFPAYADFLQRVNVNDSVRRVWTNDPANDDYHYFRGSDFDEKKTSILERYKRINMPQGNSPDNDQQTEGYDTSYKSYPDVEDINQDYTLNEYERYYQYKVSIRPEDMVVGQNFITDIREASVSLRNGTRETVKWYQFRVPLNQYSGKEGSISDFTSIRFMRMFLTNFQQPIVLRFGSLDLMRGEWRIYNQALSTGSNSGTLEVSAVNIEENNNKQPVNYVLPPGISRVTDPSQPQLTEANEQSLSMVVKNLSPGESKAVYRNTVLDLRQYKHLQMFVHANHLVNDEPGNLQDDQLAVFIRMGSDYKSNYYEYVIPLKLTPDRSDYNKYNVDDCRAVWPAANMFDIDLSVFTKVKKARNKARGLGTASYTKPFSDYDPDQPNNRITVMGNPTLGEVKTMMIGVRNLSSGVKSGEVWVNELRLQDAINNGGWAASGALNMQLSDVGTLNLTGKIISEGFGGLEDGVAARTKENYKTYSLTTTVELGKFFPDKMKVTAPLYYSVTKEVTKPKYNPLDTDMELDEALDGAANKEERDSIENIAVTKSTLTNFSLSNVRFGIKTKRHPMPYDPANFSISYSHSHRHTSGETTVYENDDQWRGSLNYSYTPVYKAWEPFKKSKSKSKWMALPKAFGLNWLPQNISFNSELTRTYYELQERDMDDLNGSSLPATFSSQFLWNRDFSIRWDLTKNLHLNFQSGTQAEIEEPYSDKPINKDLYPDRYSAWKDSVWTSIKHFGRPLDYRQTFTASYQVPLNKLPIFDWLNVDASYNATYNWVRGREKADGSTLGNTISNNRQITINSTLNMETLYNHSPFLKKVNERFKKAIPKPDPKKKDTNNNKKKPAASGSAAGKNGKEEAKLPKNKNAFEKELKLLPDSTFTVSHNKKSKRLMVSAKTKDGRSYPIKYKVVDQNKISIKGVDSTTIKLTVVAKPPLDNEGWYKTAQSAARLLMMVRSIGINYRNQYAMSVPGFLPEIGDAFGQRTGGVMAPGLGFAFGLTGESFLDKAADNGWLLMADDIATPATTNKTVDLQLRATLEPIRDLKIDLNASRTETKSRSIQYMYANQPTTQSGTFNMTTISISSSLEKMGDANNGYPSAVFERFCESLPRFQEKASAHYGTTVDKYSAAVMIPAFLDSYTGSGGGSLDIIPALTRLLPNWTIRYSGLSKLKWFNEHFKSVNLNHAYKSIFAVGSYTSSSETASLLGWNVPTVSINESFSPLIGADVTFLNNLTMKAEYRRTRVLNLSMTSVQINESRSNDIVIGLGYKISDFRLFGAGTSRKIKKAQGGSKKKADDQNASSSSSAGKKSGGVNHDLNMRFDITWRDQAAITRDIATCTSSASSGNAALKMSFMADYTLSRLLTLSAYYERQTNKPLLSSSSYPTTTHDFGLSMKFSLTR